MTGENLDAYVEEHADDGVRMFLRDDIRIVEDTKYEELLIEDRYSAETVIAADTYVYLDDMQ